MAFTLDMIKTSASGNCYYSQIYKNFSSAVEHLSYNDIRTKLKREFNAIFVYNDHINLIECINFLHERDKVKFLLMYG